MSDLPADHEPGDQIKAADIDAIAEQVNTDTDAISELGTPLTVGTTSGTVAAGDDSRIVGALQRSGGTMTGTLVLAADPDDDLDAATKQYVDANGGAVASVAGKTGTVTLAAADIASGTFTLDRAAPGTTFDVVYDGTNWSYAGSTVTARPTDRTDLIMQAVNPVDSTTPSFAITGDMLLRVE